MALPIDTTIFIGLERRQRPISALAQVAPDTVFALASITASELLVGVHRANTPARRVRREVFVEAILAAIPVLAFDLQIARTHAQLLARLAKTGQPIGAHDLLIGATALAIGFSVLTDNVRDFQRMPGLVVSQPRW